MNLTPGMILHTNYQPCRYVITNVAGPCTCARYLDQMNTEHPRASQPHYHLTCRLLNNEREGDFYLNGYRPDGSNVWSSDRLTFEGLAQGVTGDLFSGMALQ